MDSIIVGLTGECKGEFCKILSWPMADMELLKGYQNGYSHENCLLAAARAVRLRYENLMPEAGISPIVQLSP
jgi:hypothetical protein